MDNPRIFDEEQVAKLKKVGNIIKSRREELSYSLSQASDIIRISVADLRAIEQGAYAEYPNIVFLRGFIRNYCKLLDIDAQRIINIINEVYQSGLAADSSRKEKTISDYPAPIKNEASSSGGAVLLAAISGLGVILLLAAGYFSFKHFFEKDNTQALPAFESEDKPSGAALGDVLPGGSSEFHLVLQGKKAGWASIKVDEGSAEDVPIKANQSQEWRAKRTITIILSRGDVAILTINGLEEVIAEADYNKLYQRSFSR